MSDLPLKTHLEKRWRHYREPMLMALAGGAVDTISFVALYGLFTAHVTGNLVVAGAVLADGGVDIIAKLLALPVFMLAVMATATIIQRAKTNDVRLPGRLFMLESVFLFAFMVSGLLLSPLDGADGIKTVAVGMLGVCAMGIRNGITRLLLPSFSPSTMMTGNVTQLAIDLLAFLGPQRAEVRGRLQKSASSVIGFVLGAIIGAVGYVLLGFGGLSIPLIVMLGLALRELLSPTP